MDQIDDETQSRYDCVVKLTSLLGLDFIQRKGWNLSFRPAIQHQVGEYLKTVPTSTLSPDNVTTLSGIAFRNDIYRKRVAFVGLYDRGKTFVVNKLCSGGTELGSSVLTHTEGISIKMPIGSGMDQTIFLDTQGTNSPLETHVVETFTNQIESNEKKPLKAFADFDSDDDTDSFINVKASVAPLDSGTSSDFKPANPAENILSPHVIDERHAKDFVDESTRKKIEEEQKESKRNLAAKGKNQAIISKQSTEVVLQDIVINMSDVVITVLNEVTFDDQLACEYIARKLQELRDRSPDRWPQLVVIHNFKTVTDKETLNGMIEKYVESCFDGVMITREVTTIENGAATKNSVNLFQNRDNSMLHLWIAKDGSVAGGDNDIKYEYLRRYISAATQSHSRALLADLVISTNEVLKSRSYFVSLSNVSLYQINGQVTMMGKGRMVENGNRKTIYALTMAPDEVVMDGKTLTFIQPGDFMPVFDIHYTDEGMKVVMDVPGMSRKNDNVEVKTEQTKNFIKPPYIDPASNELVIEGMRLLYFPELVEQGNAYTYPKEWNNRTRVYTRDSEEYPVSVTRRKGNFVRKIKVPAQYDRQRRPVVDLRFGVLYVFIPKLKEFKDLSGSSSSSSATGN